MGGGGADEPVHHRHIEARGGREADAAPPQFGGLLRYAGQFFRVARQHFHLERNRGGRTTRRKRRLGPRLPKSITVPDRSKMMARTRLGCMGKGLRRR